jgi:hypothetical protein
MLPLEYWIIVGVTATAILVRIFYIYRNDEDREHAA